MPRARKPGVLSPLREPLSFARAYRAMDPAIADAPPGSPIPFVLSTPGVKRDGLDLSGVGFRAERYRTNPVVLAFHRYDDWPIGRGTIEVVDGPGGESLIATAEFDIDDPAGATADRKYRSGQMFAVSLGWDDVDADGVPIRTSGKRIAYRDILEFSIVAVPADPDAVIATSRSWAPDEISQARSWLVDLSGLRDVSPERSREIARTIESLNGCQGGACTTGLRDLARTLATEISQVQDGQPDAEASDEGPVQQSATNDAGLAHDADDASQEEEAQRRAVMAGMLAACWVDDPDEADDAARKELRASLVPEYRRLRLAVPPFIPARVFAGLPEGLRAALFQNGELSMALNVRVGKKISGKRAERLKACADMVRDVAREIDTILKEDAAENERGCGCGSGQSHEPTPPRESGNGTGLEAALAELSARFPDLRFTVEETDGTRGIVGVDLTEKSTDDSSSYGFAHGVDMSDEMLAKLAELVAAQIGEREATVSAGATKRPDNDPEYPVEECTFVTVRLADVPDDLKDAIKSLATGATTASPADAPAEEPVAEEPAPEEAAADEGEARNADEGVADPLLARLKAVITG